MFKQTRKNVFDNSKKVVDEARNAGRNAYLAGLGVYATAEEETKGFFDRLVEKGEKYEDEKGSFTQRAADQVRKTGQKVEDRVESTVSETLNRVGVPSRDEIRTLIERVEKLTQKVDEINA